MSTLYIPALTLPFSSVFFDSFSITLLYSRRRGSWLWHSPVNTNTAVICVMGVSLNLTTPIKFSLTLINSDVHCFLCKVYNRVDSSNINSQPWFVSVFQIFFESLYITSSKGISNSKCDVGNWKIHMCDIFKILGNFLDFFRNSMGILWEFFWKLLECK